MAASPDPLNITLRCRRIWPSAQSATSLVVNATMQDGKHLTNSYTAGEKSVVTTTRGRANRTLGWDGHDFLIRTQGR